MKTNKGNSTVVLPILFLTFGLAMLFVALMVMSGAVTGEVKESFNDLNRIAESQSFSDDYFFNYITRGVEYSANQKAYELGRQGGGVEWSWDDPPSMEDIHSNFVEELDGYLHQRYVNTEIENIECELSGQSFNVEVHNLESASSSGISGRIRAEEDMVKECVYSDGGVRHQGLRNALSASYELPHNRYFELAAEALNIFEDLQEELGEAANEEYTAQSMSCGSQPSSQQVEGAAVEKAESELHDSLNTVLDGYPETEGFEIDYSTDSEYNTEVDTSTSGECDCNSDGCESMYVTEASAEIQDVEISLSVVDERYMVLTENGWENIRFSIE